MASGRQTTLTALSQDAGDVGASSDGEVLDSTTVAKTAVSAHVASGGTTVPAVAASGTTALKLKPLKVDYGGATIDLPIDCDSSAADVVIEAAHGFGIDWQTVHVYNGPFRLRMPDHVVGMNALTLRDK